MSNENIVIPLDTPAQLTPWWTCRMKEFDGLEIWPCKATDINRRGSAVLCKPEEANMWVVYGYINSHDDASGLSLEPINEFFIEGEAERFCNRLRRCYPRLNKDRTPQDQQSLT